MGIIVVPLPGWNVMSSRAQIRSIEKMQIGRVTKNQAPQLGSGLMFCSAMIFCGEAIGEAIPPMLEASAMPRINALENFESEGKLRSIG